MNKDEALDLALEALELNNDEWKALADSGDCGYWKAEDQDHYKQTNEAITAIKQARSAPVQEPWKYRRWNDEAEKWELTDDCGWPSKPLYTTPPAAPDLQADLVKVNAQAEYFEREWYLRGDELEATNRQVEILSDALAESRREVARLKAVQEPAIKQGWDVDTLLDKPAAQRPVAEPHKWVHATEWRGLTDEEIKRIGKLDLDSDYFGLWFDFAKAIEAKLKAKNFA
jgi:hypothetical protein